MNDRMVFRGLVLASVLLAVSASLVDIIWPALLPDPIRQSLTTYEETAPTPILIILVGLSVVGLGLIASVGLLFFWRPARPLYVAGFVLGIPVAFLLGPNVTSATAATLMWLADTASGMILIAMFVPPFSHHFERGVQQTVAAAPYG